jgi:hypothetical protein
VRWLLSAATGALYDKEQGPAHGTGLWRGGVALRSGAEAGVDGRFVRPGAASISRLPPAVIPMGNW